MAEFIPPHIDRLHQQLESLKLQVELEIKADESVLDNQIIDYGLDYDPWDRDHNFPDLSIQLETLLYGNLLNYAYELAKELDAQIEILEKSDTSQEHTFLETESEGEEEPKKVLH